MLRSNPASQSYQIGNVTQPYRSIASTRTRLAPIIIDPDDGAQIAHHSAFVSSYAQKLCRSFYDASRTMSTFTKRPTPPGQELSMTKKVVSNWTFKEINEIGSRILCPPNFKYAGAAGIVWVFVLPVLNTPL